MQKKQNIRQLKQGLERMVFQFWFVVIINRAGCLSVNSAVPTWIHRSRETCQWFAVFQRESTHTEWQTGTLMSKHCLLLPAYNQPQTACKKALLHWQLINTQHVWIQYILVCDNICKTKNVSLLCKLTAIYVFWLKEFWSFSSPDIFIV